jgi:hypothetical protein
VLIRRAPAVLARALERTPRLASRGGPRFAGYGVPGVVFASGHLLAVRRVAASSSGERSTAVWHRDPGGGRRLFLHGDLGPSPARGVGEGVTIRMDEIELRWCGPAELSVSVKEARLEWVVRLASSAATVLATALSLATPAPLWRSAAFDRATRHTAPGLFALPSAAEGWLPGGPYRRPTALWRIEASAALLAGSDLGPLPATTGAGSRPAGVFVLGEAGPVG